MLEGPYSDDEIDAAVEALSDPDRLAGARDTVARIAPQLQAVLDRALVDGGWFAAAHEDQVGRAAADPDPSARRQAIAALVAEETRLGMLVGVAVGIELARELAKHPHGETGSEPVRSGGQSHPETGSEPARSGRRSHPETGSEPARSGGHTHPPEEN